MKKTISFTLRILGAFALLGAADLVHAEEIQHSTYGNIDQWFIGSPVVTSPQGKLYDQILIAPGDILLVSAGGCVQTGGHGKTWKRYVNPQGPNSDRFYHGLIQLPGIHPM